VHDALLVEKGDGLQDFVHYMQDEYFFEWLLIGKLFAKRPTF
jgi:hypothetical protein